jgi:hypothetical protein
LFFAPVEIVATYVWQIMSLRVAGYGWMVALVTENSFLCWPFDGSGRERPIAHIHFEGRTSKVCFVSQPTH